MSMIGFIGPPCSGKSTCAANLFSHLKDDGYPAEFLPEAARTYIVNKRVENMKLNHADGPLLPIDQLKIFLMAAHNEHIFIKGSPKSLTVTDSASFLAFLYLPVESRNLQEFTIAKNISKKFDLLFRCHPVIPSSQIADSNRKHSFDESLILDTYLDNLIRDLDIPTSKIVELSGTAQDRSRQTLYHTMELIVCPR